VTSEPDLILVDFRPIIESLLVEHRFASLVTSWGIRELLTLAITCKDGIYDVAQNELDGLENYDEEYALLMMDYVETVLMLVNYHVGCTTGNNSGIYSFDIAHWVTDTTCLLRNISADIDEVKMATVCSQFSIWSDSTEDAG
jgi:hypothetical protein